MKRTKKLLSIILSLAMLLSITAGLDFSAFALSSSGKCGDNVTYTFNSSTGELVISGTGAMRNYDSSSSSYRSPFYNKTGINYVIIKDGVTSIGSYAFYCCGSLTSVTIPDSVTSIGGFAFWDCSGLTSVTIPDSITSIGYGAFWYCTGLTSVTIGNSVTSIGEDAFKYCTGLTSITIPNSVTSIGYGAFDGCGGIKELTIPDSVTSIGDSAFYGCTGLTSVNISSIEAWCKISFYSFYSNPLYYAHNLYLNDELVTDLVIPDSVTSISSYAFYGCTGLKELTMPCSAKINNTFYNCSNIEKVTLTKGTGTMQDYASSTSSSTNTYYQYTPWYISRNSIKELVIEDGVTNIGSYAFYDCKSLTSVTIPDSVTSIGDSTFSGCTGLTSITIPDSVTSIGDSTFSDCTGLETVYLLNKNINCQKLVSSMKSGSTLYAYDSTNASICCSFYGIIYKSLNTLQCDENGHLYELKEIIEPTCTEKGIKTFTCTSCKNSYTEDIKVLDHTIVTDYAVAPTCKTSGLTEGSHCSTCGKVLVAQTVVPVAEHNYVQTVVAPTYSANGYTLHTCSVCKSSYKDNYTNKLIVAKPTVSKVTSPKSKQIKVTWGKKSYTGYQVQIATDKKFSKNKKTTTIKKASTTSATFTKLKGKTKYYVRVRAYKTYNGKNYYSAWSSVKTVTTKK